MVKSGSTIKPMIQATYGPDSQTLFLVNGGTLLVLLIHGVGVGHRFDFVREGGIITEFAGILGFSHNMNGVGLDIKTDAITTSSTSAQAAQLKPMSLKTVLPMQKIRVGLRAPRQ